MAKLNIALGQYDTGWQDPAGSLERAARVIERAADAGARLVVLPEMSTTGFTMESARFAEPIDGPSVTRLSDLAARHRVSVIAGVATRETDAGLTQYCNSALLLGRDGEPRAQYRKQRLFAMGGE